VQIGVLSIPSSGNITFNINDSWDGSTLTVDKNNGTPTYTVTSNGRVTLSGAGSGPPIFYLVSANKGFFLGTDSGVESGFFEPQTTTTLNPPKTVFFGTVDPATAHVSESLGVATFAGSTVSGTSDDVSGTSLNGNQTFTNTTVSSFDGNGRATISSGGGNGTIIYLISPTKAVLFDTSSTNASYQVAEQ
jgi:hypothetical protein